LFGFLADAISGLLSSFAWCPEAIPRRAQLV
jgi:hypothetical protein